MRFRPRYSTISAAAHRFFATLATDTTGNAHHAKLARIAEQTAVTRDLAIIALADRLGLLVGDERTLAETIVSWELADLLARLKGGR